MRIIRMFAFVIANGMAGFFDFSVGALIAITLALLWGISTGWEHLLLGGLFMLIPDIDIPFTDKDRDHHETFMHLPWLVLCIVIITTWVFGGGYWAMAAFCCVLGHFVHDAVAMSGWDKFGWFFRPFPEYWSARGTVDPTAGEYESWIIGKWMYLSVLSITEISLGSIALGIAIGIVAESVLAGTLTTIFFLASAGHFWWLMRFFRVVG